MSERNTTTQHRKSAGIITLMVSGALLLAACGPQATPSPGGTGGTGGTGTGASDTPTALASVVTEGTVSTDMPQSDATAGSGGSPFATPDGTQTAGTGSGSGGATGSETASPGALGTGTPGGMMEDEGLQVKMSAQNNSGQDGTTTITDMGNGMVRVAIEITPSANSTPQPAHIHKGSCPTPDPAPAFPLSNVVNGKSVTELQMSMDELTNNPYAVNVHKSPDDIPTYVSCGDIKEDGMGAATPGATGVATPGGMMESETPEAEATP